MEGQDKTTDPIKSDGHDGAMEVLQIQEWDVRKKDRHDVQPPKDVRRRERRDEEPPKDVKKRRERQDMKSHHRPLPPLTHGEIYDLTISYDMTLPEPAAGGFIVSYEPYFRFQTLVRFQI